MFGPVSFDALLLGARHVSAGDDRAEEQDRGCGGVGLEAADRRRAGSGIGGGLGTGLEAQEEQQAEQEHCGAEMGRHELLGEAVLDRQTAEAGLDQDEHARDQRAPEGPAVALPKAPVGPVAEQSDQDHDDGREEAVRELDHPVLVADERDHLAAAERPSLGAAAARAAAEPGLAHADDSADDDQQEGDNSGEVCQAAKPAEVVPAAPGNGSGHCVRLPALCFRLARAGRRRDVSQPPGCRAVARGCGRRERRRSCAAAGARW